MRGTLGIRGQLMAGIIITTVAGIGLIGVASLKVIERNALSSKVIYCETIVSFIRAIEERVSDEGERVRLVASAFKDSRLVSFSYSTGGSMLTGGGGVDEAGGTGGELLSFNRGTKVTMSGGGGLMGLISPLGDALYVSSPPGLMGGSVDGGKVDFLLSLDDIKEDLGGVRNFLLFYIILDSLIIITVGFYFLSGLVIGPIRDLEGTAVKISGGELGLRAGTGKGMGGGTEIASLANSFNTMAENLEEKIESLSSLNDELLETQDELLRSSTLAALGRLAAGFAHEIGNPLGALRGYMDILIKEEEAVKAGGGVTEEDIRERDEILVRSEREILRIDKIVRDFLDLARAPKGTDSEVELNSTIRDVAASVEGRKDFEGIRVHLLLADNLPPVSVDEGRIRQVFLNMLINAGHAVRPMDEGRREVTLKTSAGGVDPETGRSMVEVIFEDLGVGITPEEEQRIFEPFYTSRENGTGSGLGLFVSDSIVKSYGGTIKVKSGGEGGSTFTVLLPSVARSGRAEEVIDSEADH